jgi:superfamily II DNA or RNA helicase
MYVLLIFFGPQIGPGKTFTENELILQVVSQKVIVLIFTLAILSQVYGINDLVRQKSDLFKLL